MQDGTEALPSTDLSKKSHDDRSDRFPQQNSEVNGSKSHVKWKFGTTHCDDLHDDPLPQCQRNHASEESNLHTAAEHKGVSGTQSIPLRPLTLIPTAPNGHHWPVNTTPIDTSQPGSSILNSEDGSATSDVWEVKDFGFGFGDVSGCGNAQNIARWEIQQGWRSENGVEDGRGSWEQVSRPFTRPRRGSYPGYDRGYAGRRGRGFGGRYHGGRGRGSFPHQRLGSLPYAPMQQDTIPPAVDVTKEYAHIPTYAFQETTPAPAQLNARPAVPLPLPASFPLDVTRSHLLGQLEYYLSPQNLAQDYFLRQQMDNKGWIPISLLGSFNRVKYLTTDMDLVKEVLNSSSSVEVNGDWVRMAGRQWEQFILPHAGKSVVEQDETPSDNHGVEVSVSLDSREHEEEIEDCDAEDDEDEDIVFVIGEEAEESWMPERKQS
ncbi:hypothetical protein F5I97DRAFT_1815133 [Phlebopus sp. FC_14]|nr:hypothetical protein F5I97DRAFT_1815133 [Phlebopus sp. FC_14]